MAEEKPNEYESMYEQRGKSSQLPQYDDITIRRMEAVNANANLRTWIVFNKRGLYDLILTFHQTFGALVDSTILEAEEKLEEWEAERIKRFLDNPFKDTELDGTNMDSEANRKELVPVGREANAIHSIYEQALKAAGFRKIAINVLKDEHRWRENI